MRGVLTSLAVVIVLAASSCSNETGENANTVGILATGDYQVELHAAIDGPRYSVRTRSGKTVARELSRTELASRYPEIHEHLQSLWAGNDAGSHTGSPPVDPVEEIDFFESPPVEP